MIATTGEPHRDNLLGVCHAFGESFGFNPLVLRIALMIGLLLDAEATIAIYAACGVAVAVASLFTRHPARGGPDTASASSCR